MTSAPIPREFMPPPPPEPLMLDHFTVTTIQREARRQCHLFYPHLEPAKEQEVCDRMFHGILQMLKVGPARIIDGEVRFWHGYDWEFRPYDEKQNAYFAEEARHHLQHTGRRGTFEHHERPGFEPYTGPVH